MILYVCVCVHYVFYMGELDLKTKIQGFEAILMACILTSRSKFMHGEFSIHYDTWLWYPHPRFILKRASLEGWEMGRRSSWSKRRLPKSGSRTSSRSSWWRDAGGWMSPCTSLLHLRYLGSEPRHTLETHVTSDAKWPEIQTCLPKVFQTNYVHLKDSAEFISVRRSVHKMAPSCYTTCSTEILLSGAV